MSEKVMLVGAESILALFPYIFECNMWWKLGENWYCEVLGKRI